jgi:succinoglycan biosynthesis transport protein ExoP
MNNNHETPPAASVGVDDIFYLFFRHKWKIVFCTLLGFVAAGVIYFLDQQVSRAQAKIMVRYITDKKDPRFEPNVNSPEVVRPLDPRDNAIMSAEAEILKSNDSITKALKALLGGPRKVLQAYGGGTNQNEAAQLVTKNLDVDLLPKSGVMVLTFTHKDQDVAQKFLNELIEEYKRQHKAIHSPGVTYEDILAEAENIKKSLADTDSELRKLKGSAHISNLEHSKTQLETQQTDLSRQIFQTEAQLAEIRALVDARTKGTADTAKTNEVAGTGDKPQPTPAQIAEFNLLARKLNDLTKIESEYLQVFSENSKKVVQIRQDIENVKTNLNKLPIDPSMLQAASSAGPTGPVFDWEGAKAKIASLDAMHSKLTNLLASVRQDYAAIDRVEDDITQLERKKKIDEEKYAFYQKTLDEMHIDQNIDPRSRNNISVIQTATVIPSEFKKLGKKMGAAAAGGVGLGFLLALLLDYVFNPTIKRSKDLETNLRVPVLASIPDFGRRLKLKRGHAKNGAVQKNGHPYTNGEIPPWEETDPMLPYYEALRDRIVMSYNGDLHKPKIVGLTSCHPGAGVSRLAAGLAASLSRDAERNILLVGLERNKVAVSAFAKGRPTDGIEPPAEDASTDKQLVVQNLHSLATTGRNLAGASVVQSFTDLLPKLKISDYDYIIFDLPPLTQTSGSLRLASQMERAVLVVEAEETDKSNARRVTNLLKASQPKLFSVLNKAHSYGPKSLRENG